MDIGVKRHHRKWKGESDMNKRLGSPCKIGNLTIRNRTVLDSMGNGLSDLNGNVIPAEIA